MHCHLLGKHSHTLKIFFFQSNKFIMKSNGINFLIKRANLMFRKSMNVFILPQIKISALKYSVYLYMYFSLMFLK